MEARVLHGTLHAAFSNFQNNDDKDLRDLQIGLENFKSVFLNLLEDPPKSGHHRKEVEKGEVVIDGVVRKLNNEFIASALQISDMLNLDEIESVRLLEAGMNQMNRLGRTAEETACYLYYSNRQYTLQCLYDLLDGSNNYSFSDELRIGLKKYVDGIIFSSRPKTFVAKLVSLLDKFSSQDTNKEIISKEERKDHQNRENTLLSQCLYQVFEGYEPDTSDVINVANYLQKMTLDGDQEIKLCSNLICALIAGFFSPNKQYSIKKIDKDLLKKISPEWKNAGIKSCFMMIWLLYRIEEVEKRRADMSIDEKEIQISFDSCMHDGFLANIQNFIHLARNNSDFGNHIFDKLQILIEKIAEKLERQLKKIRDDQDAAALQNIRIESRSLLKRCFSQFLDTISLLFNGRPDSAIAIWEKKKLLHMGLSVRTPELTIAFCKMIGSISDGEYCSQAAFNFLSAKHSILSWPHIFQGIRNYNLAFRGIQDPFNTHSAQRPNFEMRQDEMEFLVATLYVIERIVFYDDKAGLQLNNFNALVDLFGLLSCPVPLIVKASIFKCLSSFAKSSHFSKVLWELLEGSQIISTMKGKATSDGLKFELEEIEAKYERYISSCAFSDFICQLIQNGLPKEAKINFNPYLQFFIESIFMKANTRGYKQESEKWSLIGGCLKIFYKVLSYFNPSSVKEGIEHPGFDLMIRSTCGSKFIQELFKILCSDSQEKDIIECHKYCLKIIHLVMNNQEKFFKMISSPGAKVPHEYLSYRTEKLERILLSKPEVIVRISLMVNYSNSSSVCLYSTRVLRYLSTSNVMHGSANKNLLLGVICQSPFQYDILRGFCFRLESEFFDIDDLEESDLNNVEQRDVVRIEILDFIIEGLNLRSINLSHFLLGFNWKEGVKSTQLQDYTFPGTQLTCLHVIVEMMERDIEEGDSYLCRSYPEIAERCYRLIYELCANEDTSMPTLRYLRSKSDLILRHFDLIPVLPTREKVQPVKIEEPESFSHYYYRSWLMKTVAVELHTATLQGHVRQRKRIIDLLFKEPITSMNVGPEQPRMKALEILHSVNFESKKAPAPVFNFKFHPADYLEETDKGFSVYGISQVEQLLKKNGVEKMEIDLVLKSLQENNEMRRSMHANYTLLKGWKEMCLVALLECFYPSNEISLENAIDLMSALMSKITSADNQPAMVATIAEVLVTIMAKIRENKFESEIVSGSQGILKQFPIERLHEILQSIVTAILSPGCSQEMKGNFCTILLNYLQYTSPESHQPFEIGDVLDYDIDPNQVSIDNVNLSILNKQGKRIIEELCKQSEGVWKTVSFSTLDSMVVLSLRGRNHLLYEWILKSNVIQEVIQDIKYEDTELQKLLSSKDETMNHFFIFESKMSLLLRLSQLRQGSEQMLKENLMEVLTECKFIDFRPDEAMMELDDSPDSTEMCRQLFNPVLRLTCSILATIGKTSDEEKIHDFVLGHIDLFIGILRDKVKNFSIQSLTELKYVTCVFYFLSRNYSLFEKKFQSYLVKLQNLSLELLAKYTSKTRLEDIAKLESPSISSERVISDLLKYSSPTHQKADKMALDICRNLLGFCRNISKSDLCDFSKFTPLFFHSFTPRDKTIDQAVTAVLKKPPTLWILQNHLDITVKSLLDSISNQEQLLHKISHVADLPHDVINLISNGNSIKMGELSPTQKQLLVLRVLKKANIEQTENILQYLWVIENDLFLLWNHLSYYYHTKPTNQQMVNELEQLKKEAVGLRPTLGKVSTIELKPRSVGEDFKLRSTFIGMLVRMIRDLIMSGETN